LICGWIGAAQIISKKRRIAMLRLARDRRGSVRLRAMSEAKPKTPADARSAGAGPGKIKVIVGRALNRAGHMALPAGIGAVLGFYAADQGMRWLPTLLGIVLVIFLLGFLAIPAGRFLQGEAFVDTPERKGLRRRVVVFLVLAMAAVILRLSLFAAEMSSPLTSLSEAEFNEAFEIDAARYRELERGMEGVVASVEASGAEFGLDRGRVLGADQERRLLTAWRSAYDTAFALDQLRHFYRDWFRFDPSRAERSYHLRAFLLAFAAELALHEKSARLLAQLDKNENAVKYLNAPHPDVELPQDTVSMFREDLAGTRDLAEVAAGAQYLAFLDDALGGREEARGLGAAWLWADIEQRIAALEAVSPLRKAGQTLGADIEPLKRETKRNWYPTQKSIAGWMGDTRFKRIGRYLVTHEQQEQMDRALQPGDVMLARKNWYLSNVGLPGFWPHAILYLGEPEKLERYFDTPEVRAYVKELSGRDQTLGRYLAERWPTSWASYRLGEGDQPYRVIEAVSEGVIFNTLHHVCGDYVAALRPRLSKVVKARAIVAAFSHLGKPYDFEFDFATDHALVCTELVWRSYRSVGEEVPGLDIPLTEVMGRMTLPANEIAKLYAEERGASDRQLDFVYFLDASEQDERAFVADEQAFAESYLRPKWDLAQK